MPTGCTVEQAPGRWRLGHGDDPTALLVDARFGFVEAVRVPRPQRGATHPPLRRVVGDHATRRTGSTVGTHRSATVSCGPSGSSTACCSTRTSRPPIRGATRRHVRRRGHVRRTEQHLLVHVDGRRARTPRRVRPADHGAPGHGTTDSAPPPARRSCDQPRSVGAAADRSRRRHRYRRRGSRHGRAAFRGDDARPPAGHRAAAAPRGHGPAPSLGRRRGTLPLLRQLHAGLPTCFCTTFSDHTSLGTDDTVREQSWASCFQLEHSNLGGRPVRATTAARYRQWLTHKLQTWPDQFGTFGCVGCGRCTTWCPAGIDIVEEANVLRGGIR